MNGGDDMQPPNYEAQSSPEIQKESKGDTLAEVENQRIDEELNELKQTNSNSNI